MLRRVYGSLTELELIVQELVGDFRVDTFGGHAVLGQLDLDVISGTVRDVVEVLPIGMSDGTIKYKTGGPGKVGMGR